MRVRLPVCVYFSTSALSHAASLGKLPSHQFCYSPQPSLRTADNVRRRHDSSWDEASPLIPPPTFPSSFSLSLSVYQLSVCVPGFLALTGWLESHSGTVALRPKQGLMSEDTLFSLFPFSDGYHMPVCGHIAVYLSLETLIGCLQSRRSCFVLNIVIHFFVCLSSACFIHYTFCAFPRMLSNKPVGCVTSLHGASAHTVAVDLRLDTWTQIRFKTQKWFDTWLDFDRSDNWLTWHLAL